MGCNDCHTPLKMGPRGPEPDTVPRADRPPAGSGDAAAPHAAAGTVDDDRRGDQYGMGRWLGCELYREPDA